MREFEDELVDHAVYADRPAHELYVSICRVVEDEIVTIEDAQVVSPDTTSDLPKVPFSRFLELIRLLL